MDMTLVESSHIEAIGHDGKETMHVRYKPSKTGPAPTYAHTPISADEHGIIMKRIGEGESAGKIIRNLDVKGVRLAD